MGKQTAQLGGYPAKDRQNIRAKSENQRWVRQHEVDSGIKEELSTEERNEIKREILDYLGEKVVAFRDINLSMAMKFAT